MKKLNYVFLSLLLLFVQTIKAQTTYIVTFNENGQIISELPSVLTNKDKIEFAVIGTRGAYEGRVLQTYSRFIETLKNLDVRTADDRYQVLRQVGLDEATNYGIMWGVQKKIAQNLLNWLYKDPDVKRIIAKKRNLGEDVAKLKTFANLQNATTIADNELPDIKVMSNSKYIVEYSFISPNQVPVKREIKLSKNAGNLCNCVFESAGIKTSTYTDENTRFSFKLRLQNNLYDVLNNQLLNIASLLGRVNTINIDNKKKAFKSALKAITADATKARFIKFLDNGMIGKEDTTEKAALVPIFDKTKQGDSLLQVLQSIYTDDLCDLVGPDPLKLMLLMSWVNKGSSLTLNPLTDGLPIDYKGVITSKTETLADSTRSLNVVIKKIDLYENMLKPTGQNGYQNANYSTQLTAYNGLLSLQTKINKEIQKLTKEITELTEKQAKNNKGQAEYKKTLLSDSLFYSGYLNLTHHETGVNHFGYRYMRNHDALNDYRHFDTKVKKEINEMQQLEVIAHNQDPKNKITIKYTFTDAGTDVDFLGTNIPGAVAKGGGSAKIDDIFKEYERLQKLFTPYGNGIIALPLTPILDLTPNYISKTNVVPDADKIPAKASYTFLDSATAKNLTIQSTAFTYRINKLYRFRLKAGITHSFLERRNYTLNTNNTTSYTTSYAGTAPSFGVQIFPVRIDIQRSNFFPTRYVPFAYIGYMFNDAPGNNFLLGGGWEVISGFSLLGGCHLGKSQKLFSEQGILQVREKYKAGWFVSASFGLEAFKAIFNSAKTITNPFVK